MNVYDSEVARGVLKHSGFDIIQEFVSDASKDTGVDAKADIFLMNTCSVREHAEDRVYSRLGALGKEKKQNPDLIVGLMGCMVEEHKEKLFKRFPQLDLMVGTRNIKDLPQLIEEVQRGRRQVSKIKQDGISIEYTDLIQRSSEFFAWLPIMTGCNKVCTFCIVPTTRGREVSMEAREVYREASRLVDEGVKWITLLGQNVNSYNGHQTTDCRPQTIENQSGPLAMDRGPISFPELLDMLCEIKGLERISFTTSHPHDATKELYEVIARNPKISRRFHLPLQSGSDRMLKRMKRLHTYAEFKDKIDRMRAMIPGVSVTSDIIAGFSGETEEDHEATVKALKELRFDGAFIYKYSVRPGTPASKLEDDVSIHVKEERNQELLKIQKCISTEINGTYLNQTKEVFVEGINPKNPAQVLGRSHEEKKVVFQGEKALLGTFRKVKFKALRHETFLGELAE